MNNREGIRGILGHLAEFERTQWLSAAELHDLQSRRLRELVRHAYDNTIYYREIFDDYGIVPSRVCDISDLSKLPELTKAIIRSRFSDLVAENLDERAIHGSETGGTSGVKMKFVRDNACLAPKAAATIRHERWTGWDLGKRKGLVWPAAQDYVGYRTWKAKLRNHLTSREIVLPAAVLDDERISRFAIELVKRKLALLRGFSTPLYLVAQYLLRNRNLRCRVPAVISTGEPLFGHMRDTIETAFDARVFDSYGAREVALIAQECPAHTGMHINAESVIVETVGPPVDGKYRLLITDLFNYGMPFLRYEIGDMGAIMNNTCSCGRGLPLMEMGVGREADIMYTPDGRVVPAVTMVLYLVDNGPAVGQVQVEQDAIDHLIVRLTKDPPPDDCLFGFYRQEIAKLFGEKMTVTFEVVDTIANESSGKYKFARCTIPSRDIPLRYRA